MTQAEYISLYAKARRQTGRLTRATVNQIKKIYIQASDDLAIVIRNSELAGVSQLTIQSLDNLNRQLLENVSAIQTGVYDNTIDSMYKTAGFTGSINETYLTDKLDIIDTSGLITKAGVGNMINGVNTAVINSLINRIYQNGYTFAESVWVAANDYQSVMKNVIAAGFAQNRDLFKIAKDIQVYTADGKIKLLKRYKKLKSETRPFIKRIPKNVDWRAVRLVRSELYTSLQDASKEQGRANPGTVNLYAWILSAGRQDWNCECESIRADSPYKYENIPAYPHPNCQCEVRPILRDSKKFENDLAAWSNGKQVDYIDEWYNDYYLQLAG